MTQWRPYVLWRWDGARWWFSTDGSAWTQVRCEAEEKKR